MLLSVKKAMSNLLLRFLDAAIPSRRSSLRLNSNACRTSRCQCGKRNPSPLPSNGRSLPNLCVSPFASLNDLVAVVESVASSNGLIPFPTTEPPHYNACNEPCDMLSGPCACGAWHTVEERWVRNVLWKLNSSKGSSGSSPESTTPPLPPF